jgi:NAD(P)-dependent dehydrogenase (short-subunit alcohol dehydrogenase family)
MLVPQSAQFIAPPLGFDEHDAQDVRDPGYHSHAAVTIKDQVVVVTGGANGIGRALCQRFAKDSAGAVVVADRDPAAEGVAREIGGFAVILDVSVESEVGRLVSTVIERFGRVDLFCSNAGISVRGSLETTTDAEWQTIWQVNVMAHVYAARAVLPVMLAAGGGYLLQTASAAGLLTQIGGAPYAVTKHAAVAFAEWLSITYGDRGIKVSCLCPQGVRTQMLEGAPGETHALLDSNALDPDVVADAVTAGLADERFLILPHPEVAEYVRRKANDHDRWIRGMRRLQERVSGRPGK